MSLKSHFRAWWAARHPRSDTPSMGQRNIYILPSRAGLAFCATLALLLLASINDQLSLGYLLTFLLTGAGLASMHSTHGNLRGLSLDLRMPQPAFAGDDVQLELRLHNSGKARYGIGVQVQSHAPATAMSKARSEIAWTDVPALGHALLQVRFPAAQRGQQVLPTLHIVTRFPLGLFRAWSVWRPAASFWVYPRPENPVPPFPPQQGGSDGQALSRATPQQGQDFDGVRAYRRGDPMKQVLWKKAALSFEQGTPLWVRDSQAPAAQQLWLDWRDTATLAPEARIARLTAWVLAAEQRQAPYGLSLGAQRGSPALGAEHRQHCLEQLALLPGTVQKDAP